MAIRPLNDVLIIEHDANETIKSSILVAPDDNSANKISQYATVVSAGSKCHYEWKTGDRIIINRYFDKPMWLQLEDKKYRFIREHYIEARVEE